MTARRKVLAIAYACNPYKGSEEGVGWGWVRMIAKNHDVWVIVAEYHRADIETFCKANPEEVSGLNFVYVDHKPWHYSPTKFWIRVENSIFKPIMNSAYRLWQRDAYNVAQNLHSNIGFDLCHLITYVGFRFPGKFWKLGMPFVWGPIGGLENTPWRFLPTMGLYGGAYYAGRNIINAIHRVLLQDPKHAIAKAGDGVIAATEGIQREIRRWYGVDSHILCEIGPPSNGASEVTKRSNDEMLRLAWSGEHLPGKALPLLLDALSQLPANLNWRLDILGDGPLKRKWQKLANRLGINDRCNWHGLVARDHAVSLMHRAHLFVITSLKDLTSSVLLEALSQGVPIICPDHCGFSNVVNERCGKKISIDTPEQFSGNLAQAIMELADNEPLRRKLGAGALERAQDFSWEKKSIQLNDVYMQVIR